MVPSILGVLGLLGVSEEVLAPSTFEDFRILAPGYAIISYAYFPADSRGAFSPFRTNVERDATEALLALRHVFLVLALSHSSHHVLGLTSQRLGMCSCCEGEGGTI